MQYQINNIRPVSKTDMLKNLHADILRLQGFKPLSHVDLNLTFSPLIESFPHILKDNGAAIWVSASRTVFPPALKHFGLRPDHFLFIDLKREQDVAWATEESLKCRGISAVVGEMRNIDFTLSRRLQLAVEHSHATGFIIRSHNKKLNTTACISRWKITSLPSQLPDNLPGVGFPKWKVELLRMRNGKPGVWELQWIDGRFQPCFRTDSMYMEPQQKVG
jgi:protein ImuA